VDSLARSQIPIDGSLTNRVRATRGKEHDRFSEQSRNKRIDAIGVGAPHRTPIPTQIVASDEYYPGPQTEKQREVEARLLAMADDFGGRQGLDRRRFFQTAAGMAAAFVAMNEVYGGVFDATPAEAATPAMARERADGLKGQFVMDMIRIFCVTTRAIRTSSKCAAPSKSSAGTRN
jgi:hypothetical protein